ncbi:hypothetical protein EMQ25_08165 [Arsenicitalea aurantiaca]|uniref:Integral membrane protein n=1 Tax=Arsenicitalea aurantiaca TaxID=1783274 RepID=A0A433XG57_9HYPH|nr:Pr6Pr family membrane protein [Arsenicitalea aurantiaca]RUT33089.1 hypothetical protein EMQ25_08165 [Arsenicitalea aurantiaca]
MGLRRPLAMLGMLVGAIALAIQFSLTVPAAMAVSEAAPEGRTLLMALIFFFSFFTILSNIALVLVYLSGLSRASALAIFRHPVTRGLMVSSITLVMIFYHLLLAQTWSPEGLFLVADTLLHYVTPVLYIAWWVLYARTGTLHWRHLPIMLLPTLVYFLYALLRGAVVGEYPYPILEADSLGYGQVLINAGFVAIGLAVLSSLVVLIDKAPRPAPNFS